MKKLFTLLFALAGLTSGAAIFSTYTTTNSANLSDLFILDSGPTGGPYSTRTITGSNLWKTLANASGVKPMAYQDTNAPVFNNATHYGYLTLSTNGTYGPDGNGASLEIPDYTFIRFGAGATIRNNPTHGPASEFEILGQSRISLIMGYDNQGNGALQIGTPGPTHEVLYVNSDVLYRGTDFQGGNTNYGPSKFLRFDSGCWSNGNVLVSTGIRSETYDTNGTTEMRYYNPANTGNPVGVGSVNGTEQLAIGKGYVRIDGAVVNQANSISSTSSGTNFIYWTNAYDQVTPTVSPLTNVATIAIQPVANFTIKKEVRYYAKYVNVGLTWPSYWRWLTTTPATLTNATMGRLTLTYNGGSDTNFDAEWAVAPYTYTADSNVTAFVNASGVTNLSQVSAVTAFVASAKAKGYWSNMLAFYPFVGGTSNSCSWNLINTNLYQIGFTGGTFANGFQNGTGSGATCSNLVPSTAWTNANYGGSGVWITSTAIPSSGQQFYSANGGSGFWIAYMNTPPTIQFLGPDDNGGGGANANFSPNAYGLLAQNDINKVTTYYVNSGTPIGTVSQSGTFATSAFVLLPNNTSTVNLGSAGFWSSFSTAQMSNYVVDVTAFATALGR